jgi:hypothetical protein
MKLKLGTMKHDYPMQGSQIIMLICTWLLQNKHKYDEMHT